MFDLSRNEMPFAMATIVAADGGPRPVGAQMVVTPEAHWGFLSGGCIEDDVALHARQVLADGAPRSLVYGRGSPFIDIRLPCGGRLEVMIERIPPRDEAVRVLERLTNDRQPALWQSDGNSRRCQALRQATGDGDYPITRVYQPIQRLIVVGSDPYALAIAQLGDQIDWDTLLLAPHGPRERPPFGLRYDRRPCHTVLTELALDEWTAVAVATHDLEADEEALVAALASPAGYVGVLGSRRKLDEREARLRKAGVPDARIAQLHAPIGKDIGASSPWEVGIATIAQIIETADKSASGWSFSGSTLVHADG